MASKSLLVALWFLGTVVAATVAWQSLRLVGGTGDVAAGTLPLTALTVPTDPADPEPPLGDGTAPSTTAATSSSASSGDPDPAPATAPAGAADTHQETFTLTGGSTEVRFGPEGIEVLWATPAPGYTARIEDEGGGVIKVEFRSGRARSRIDLWWDDGPRFSQREE